ncbi:MAG: hypothetical protein NT018_08175 [Armatimonadetes bacterium]|nr:hypothetical protein [Armatimonadota bacterium]
MNKARYAVVTICSIAAMFYMWYSVIAHSGLALCMPLTAFFCGAFVSWWRLKAALLFAAFPVVAFIYAMALWPDLRSYFLAGLALILVVLMLSWGLGRGVRLLWTAGQLPRD